MDPSRLVETTWVGLERELLRSALDEVTPEAVRTRVRESVAVVLASSTSLPAALPAEAPIARSAGCEVVPSQNPNRSTPGAARRRLATKLALALKSVHAVYLSSAVAVAAGSAVLLQHWPGQSARSASCRRAGHPPAHDPLSQGQLRVPEPDAPALAPAASLGAQLQLLGATRAYLESGRLDEAGSLLDGYEQRFPGGVLAPQIAGLRADLRERRAAGEGLP